MKRACICVGVVLLLACVAAPVALRKIEELRPPGEKKSLLRLAYEIEEQLAEFDAHVAGIQQHTEDAKRAAMMMDTVDIEAATHRLLAARPELGREEASDMAYNHYYGEFLRGATEPGEPGQRRQTPLSPTPVLESLP